MLVQYPEHISPPWNLRSDILLRSTKELYNHREHRKEKKERSKRKKSNQPISKQTTKQDKTPRQMVKATLIRQEHTRNSETEREDKKWRTSLLNKPIYENKILKKL